jgi:hypothetical protein
MQVSMKILRESQIDSNENGMKILLFNITSKSRFKRTPGKQKNL